MAPRVVRRLQAMACLLYTSDAADERSSVDLGGRRIIKKNKNSHHEQMQTAIVEAPTQARQERVVDG